MRNKTLRLVLGDQLNINHSWWSDDPCSFTVLMAETRSETGYVKHHIQKVTAFFLAMRKFAEALEKKDIEVIYLKLDDPRNQQSIGVNIKSLIEGGAYSKWAYQLPDEYRLDKELRDLTNALQIPCEVYDSEHFLSGRKDLAKHFEGKKTYVMESFYRMMRRKHEVLIVDSEPAGHHWNFDKENRKPIPEKMHIPPPKVFHRSVSEITDLLVRMEVETIGRIDTENFIWPVTREESLEMLDYFIENLLYTFGNYQDGMLKEHWSLYHSRISFVLNVKLIHPMEVIRKVEVAWRMSKGDVPIASAEGFIRQILGWREYMRGVYWAQMPKYATLNYFGHSRKLPSWFWTGETQMECMRSAINQSLDHSYAHHIQRLMVTGNFALMAGIDPDQIDTWYLGIYLDAIEWVEITNTRGMSQYADGGLVATKPYVSTANYIDKMSNYCQGCYYNKNLKVGEKSCPFNALYWDFYDRNKTKLEDNARIGFVYPTLNKMKKESLTAILEQAKKHLDNIENL